jgi:DNA-binding HxlR family transcriptional regulator
VSKQNFVFPALIKTAISGLDNDTRLRVLESLINNGRMSYSKLHKDIDVPNKGRLNFHLRILSKSAIIQRFEDLSKATGERSFYDISPIGRDLINGLLSVLSPTPEPLAFGTGEVETAPTSANKYALLQDITKLLAYTSVPISGSALTPTQVSQTGGT